jgi:uncharacterized protein YidB (DUF937 family)
MIEKRPQPNSSFDSLVPLAASSSPFRHMDRKDMRIVKALLQKLAQETPEIGLGGVAQRLGPEVLNEWIASSTHAPVDPTALTRLCTDQELEDLKDAAGVTSVDELRERLARILPHIVQYLAPIGEIPSNKLLTHNIRSLLGQLG